VYRFLPALKGTGLACGLQDQDAYILAIQALSKAIQAIDSYQPRPGATLRSWVFRILMNGIRDFARGRKRQLENEVSLQECLDASEPRAGIDDEPPSGSRGIAQGLTIEEGPAASPTDTVLGVALDRMSPRERDVMIRTAEGVSDADIATELGITRSAVRVARARARSRALDALTEILPTLDEAIHRRLRKLLG